MKFLDRLNQQGPRLELEAVAPERAKTPFKTDLCLPRMLVLKAADGTPDLAKAVVHVELAPLLVGGVEAARVMLATRELLRDVLAGAVPGEFARELREALQHIDQLAQSIEAGRIAAQAEHQEFHAAEQRRLKLVGGLQ